jgi:hypothetical protein
MVEERVAIKYLRMALKDEFYSACFGWKRFYPLAGKVQKHVI